MRTKQGWRSAEWKDFTPSESDKARQIVRGGYAICRYDIPLILADPVVGYIHWWGKYKRYGWPYAGGWAEQPAVLVDIIDAIENEADKANGERAGRS